MTPRALPILLLLAAAPALAGDAGPAQDPFALALLGKSGPVDVARPPFDPDLAAVSWTTRPRREVVDALAARLLRGEADGWFAAAKEVPLPAPPPRIPADFDAGKFEVSDRLAARIPADAAVAFFGSLSEAEDAVDQLAKFLPGTLPGLCDDSPGGTRDALRRAVDMLLLPTIWRSNPGVRTGTRQIAVVASDPDLRWAPDIALVAEVDDASLVRFHRQSSLSWEDRGLRRFRVDGLDVVADDGSVRSYFALEGGVAIWATTKSLRDRILAVGSGKAPTLLSPDPRAYALARKTFPAAQGGALLVIPDAFLARLQSRELRSRRAAALRCEAVRLLRGARSLAGSTANPKDAKDLVCPAGGEIRMVPGSPGSSCSIHGSASFPTPLGDLPEGVPSGFTAAALAAGGADVVLAGEIPVAVRWGGSPMEVLVPPRPVGNLMAERLATFADNAGKEALRANRVRITALNAARQDGGDSADWFRELCGLEFEWHGSGRSLGVRKAAPRESGGVLCFRVKFVMNINGAEIRDLLFEWR